MFVSVLLVRITLAELRRRGLEVDHILRRARISQEELADIRSRISLDRVDEVVSLALEASGDPALGLSIGMNMPESSLQVLGHLLVSCKTLREAATHFFQFSKYLVEGARWELREEGELAYFIYDRPYPTSATARVGVEGILAASLKVSRHFVPNASPIEVWFKHDAPDDPERYEQAFGCPVRFGCAMNATSFPRSLLDAEQLYPDETMVKVLRDATSQVMREGGSKETVAERVRILLRYETDLSELDMKAISRRLGLARSTVRAKLAAEGVKITKLIDEARCRLACEELRRPQANIKELAQRLGFADRTAFHRAFKRWTGLTPAQFSQSVEGEDEEPEPSEETPPTSPSPGEEQAAQTRAAPRAATASVSSPPPRRHSDNHAYAGRL